MERYLMNPNTGTVNTEEHWKAEMANWTHLNDDGIETASVENQHQQFDSLIEVVQDKSGSWVEAR